MSDANKSLIELLVKAVTKVQVDTRQASWLIYLNVSGLEKSLDKQALVVAEQYFYDLVPELKKVEFIGTNKSNDTSEDSNRELVSTPLAWQAELERESLQQRVNQNSSNQNALAKHTTSTGSVLIGKKIKSEPVAVKSVQQEERKIVLQGRVFNTELRDLRSGRCLLTFNITDNTDSITVKKFITKAETSSINGIKDGCWVRVCGPVQQDKYSQELTLMVNDINAATVPQRLDDAPEKRVELHLHTKMSAMDGVLDVAAAIQQAADWGHPAIAITDHGVLQSYPEAASAGKKAGIKVIYGLEGYLIDDGKPVVEQVTDNTVLHTAIMDTEFVIFDVETTGLHPRSCEIIEIGAVKMRGREIIAEFSMMINPGQPLPLEIVKITGINDGMLQDAPGAQEALSKFQEFVDQAVLVAHNADFDMGFIRVHFAKYLNTTPANAVLDTLTLARVLHPKLKNHKLKTLCVEFKISLENHHRALDDAKATATLLNLFLEQSSKKEVKTVADLNKLTGSGSLDKIRPSHVTILVKNQLGLKNLYNLVSQSHLKYYYRHPRIPKSLLSAHREGLLIGSACERGELFAAIMSGVPSNKINELVAYYDYLEIQPAANSEFLVTNGQLPDLASLKQVYQKIYQLGQKFNKLVVATGDVHFLAPEDGIYRQILMHGQGYSDADRQAPLYFKTTGEMLAEFDYLGTAVAQEVVITNSRQIAAQIDQLLPVPQETYQPKIAGSEQMVTDMAEEQAKKLYGTPLPELVQERLAKELKSIIGNGFAVLYLIAHKLVRKSKQDGYLVGSRGSVGSSLVATFTGITEVNPLPPHYRCPDCQYSEFITDGSVGCGADLPAKNCPQCDGVMEKDGHDIPFEVFMGFEGDKVPDIDLNFSGEYQAKAHKYTEELFGAENVFRAGTISTIADKTAYGFVKKYLDEKELIKRDAEINRLVAGCTGVKRTTGQHPGGIMVVPKEIDIHSVTPLQHPADDKKSGVITTHFDYHSIHDCLVKLDILGHDDPTMIKMLEDLTGIDAATIPFDDPDTLSLFSGTKALGVTAEQIRSPVGSYAVPEFGTKFVRQMLVDTKPATFSDLVRISGFSHGTDVWLNNAQALITAGTCTVSEAISTRDDIMVYLIYKKMSPKQAFKIMEKVRKGKGVTAEDAETMRQHGVPAWYLESCRRIKYMFPKAHATAYVMMAFRIAWFKVKHPLAFYATYFTVRADDFDAELIVPGQQVILKAIAEIEAKGITASTKEKKLLTVLEVALEMQARGLAFKKVDLMNSAAVEFQIADNHLLPPLASLQGVGENAAASIVQARTGTPFTSIEDLQNRAKVSKTVIEAMQQHGCLQGMEATNQLTLF